MTDPIDMEPKCKNCRFLDNFEMRCHRYPPQIPGSVFPLTDYDKWCGEFKPNV